MKGERRDCACPIADHKHGTWLAHQADLCRCEPCVTAYNRYCKHLRHRRAVHGGRVLYPGVGVARRLQALARIGWSSPKLAERLGLTRQAVDQLRNGTARPTLTPRTVMAISALYDELWATTPTGGYSERTRCYAERMGWAPPLAWDDDGIDDPAAKPAGQPRRRPTSTTVDEVAVREALAGRSVALTRAERAEAVRLATERRYSAERISELLGTTARTVVRDRAKVAA